MNNTTAMVSWIVKDALVGFSIILNVDAIYFKTMIYIDIVFRQIILAIDTPTYVPLRREVSHIIVTINSNDVVFKTIYVHFSPYSTCRTYTKSALTFLLNKHLKLFADYYNRYKLLEKVAKSALPPAFLECQEDDT